MAYQLFTRVSLKEDFPEYGLHEGDLATIVEKHDGEPGQEIISVFLTAHLLPDKIQTISIDIVQRGIN